MRCICRRSRAAARLGFAVLTACVVLAWPARAHDIPNQILLNGFVKQEAETLHLALRVPLIMLTGIDLPKRGPGYLVLDRIDGALGRAIAATSREVVLYEDGAPLRHRRVSARISMPSDRSFESYEAALARIEGPPLPATETVFWNQGYFDVHFEYPLRAAGSDIGLDFRAAPGLSGRLKLVLRYLPAGGSVRAYEIHGGYGMLALDPSWYQAAGSFVRLGFDHILDGIDHLLFLLCLIVPFRLRHFWNLAAVITSFTVAHSVTLIASALGLAPAGDWFPPLVEVLIAGSILYMALENVLAVLRDRGGAAILRWRWLVTGGFGLVHGFGFSFALKQDLQFAGDHLLVSLLAFNVGVELGQLLVLALVLPAVVLVLRRGWARRAGIGLLSAFIAHTAWHWTLERGGELRYVEWPVAEVDGAVALAVAVLLLALAGVAAWAAIRALERRRGASRSPAE